MQASSCRMVMLPRDHKCRRDAKAGALITVMLVKAKHLHSRWPDRCLNTPRTNPTKFWGLVRVYCLTKPTIVSEPRLFFYRHAKSRWWWAAEHPATAIYPVTSISEMSPVSTPSRHNICHLVREFRNILLILFRGFRIDGNVSSAIGAGARGFAGWSLARNLGLRLQ